MRPEDKVTLSFFKELSSFKDNGTVSLVQHIDTLSLYVKKTLPVSSKDLFLALQELSAPGTPKIHHILELDSDNIIIIEDYINGKTLESVMHEGRTFHEAEALHIILQICSTLLELHNTQPPIIHRDIKPSNIIVSEDLDVMLIDFDASKLYDPDKSRDTVLMGTFNYAAPEQFGFSQSDARTDIYALGILLNKMLTGFLPNEVLYQGKLSGVIKKCIHIDPEERYSSIEVLTKILLKHSARANKNFEKENLPVSKKWTLPGFRSNTTWKKVIAVTGYILLIWFASISEFENATPLNTLLNRLSIIWWGFTVVAVFTNYRNFAGTMPLSKNRHPIIKYLGCLIWSLVALILALTVPDTVCNLFSSQ